MSIVLHSGNSMLCRLQFIDIQQFAPPQGQVQI